jgi:lysine-N-methylase
MKLRRPDFYRDFRCIAGACGDTCCAGWEIEIDSETAERYASVPGAFGEKIRADMGRDGEEQYFRLGEGRRCPFLDRENLCRIIQELGEEWLCDICREHPRFYQWFGNYTEAGLGLCCEEACRLLFEREEPLRFEILEENAEADEEEEEDILLEPLLHARETAFAIVQSRAYDLDRRIRALLHFAEVLNASVQAEEAENIEKLAGRGASAWLEDTGEEPENRKGKTEEKGTGKAGDAAADEEERVKKVLEAYCGLESLDGTWGGRMERLIRRLPELLAARREFLSQYGDRQYEYEHLAVYFLYRYFMEALFDGCVLPPVRFSAASLLVIQLMDTEIWLEHGAYTEADRIRTAKLYSKEIEYCPENMEALREVFQ